jgi:uncharacterized membrane protein SirB2
MDLASFYPLLKNSHLLMVAISIPFFMARGGSKILGLTWQNQKWAKVSPHILDTCLLLSGIFLMFATTQYPIEQSWLTSKLILLVGYILFGIKTMRSHSAMQQRLYFALSLLSALLMITIARTHHPLGLFSLL